MKGMLALVAYAATVGELCRPSSLDGGLRVPDGPIDGRPPEGVVPLLGECEFKPREQLSVVTERSLWLVRPDTYCRMPRNETPRPQERSIEGRMDDGRWHPYRRIWWFRDLAGLGMRIHPVTGPPDGRGIYSGLVVGVLGTWALADNGAVGGLDG